MLLRSCHAGESQDEVCELADPFPVGMGTDYVHIKVVCPNLIRDSGEKYWTWCHPVAPVGFWAWLFGKSDRTDPGEAPHSRQSNRSALQNATLKLGRTRCPGSINLQRIAIAGATGYIGGRLAPRLLGAGYALRCLARSPRKLEGREWASDSPSGDPESRSRRRNIANA